MEVRRDSTTEYSVMGLNFKTETGQTQKESDKHERYKDQQDASAVKYKFHFPNITMIPRNKNETPITVQNQHSVANRLNKKGRASPTTELCMSHYSKAYIPARLNTNGDERYIQI